MQGAFNSQQALVSTPDGAHLSPFYVPFLWTENLHARTEFRFIKCCTLLRVHTAVTQIKYAKGNLGKYLL